MKDYFGRTLGTCIVGLGLLAFVISAPADDRKSDPGSLPRLPEAEASSDAARAPAAEKLSADVVLNRWPDIPKQVARAMIQKYGPPEEVADDELVWRNNGPWKKTVVSRSELDHDFPYQHVDVLEQWISYRVPLGRFDDLARFDGSVLPDRTAGLLAARSDSEAMNILALNLADDICKGRRGVDDARRYMARTAALSVSGKTSPYTEGFRFEIAPSGQAEPDQSLTTAP